MRDRLARLADARRALANLEPTPGTSALRGKTHGMRVDANLRRAAALAAEVERLEREVVADVAPAGPVDVAGARFVRTRWGWHEVVKVNVKSVRVLAAPGMDDRIPIGRILEIRTQ